METRLRVKPKLFRKLMQTHVDLKSALVMTVVAVIAIAMVAAALLSWPVPDVEPLQTPAQGTLDVPKAITDETSLPVPAAADEGRAVPVSTDILTLVDIFEQNEAGVVRVSVQRPDTLDIGRIGSGFVFDKQGHIVTNAHVVSDATKIVVTLTDGMEYNAELTGMDPFTDIAVIRIDADPSTLHPMVLGDSSNLRVGEQVAAIGNPFGLSGSMTAGIVSQIGRLIPAHESGFSIPEAIQTDAAINPGNSGGPLLNMWGGVVGINTAIQSGTGQFAGVGFAVPSQTVAKIVPSLIRDGEYRHPWLGVTGQNIDPDLARLLNLTDTLGFLIVDVVPDSPASEAGLHGTTQVISSDGVDYLVGGDIVRSIDGVEVRKIDDILIHLQRNKAVGDQAVLEILRDGSILEITVSLGERPSSR